MVVIKSVQASEESWHTCRTDVPSSVFCFSADKVDMLWPVTGIWQTIILYCSHHEGKMLSGHSALMSTWMLSSLCWWHFTCSSYHFSMLLLINRGSYHVHLEIPFGLLPPATTSTSLFSDTALFHFWRTRGWFFTHWQCCYWSTLSAFWLAGISVEDFVISTRCVYSLSSRFNTDRLLL